MSKDTHVHTHTLTFVSRYILTVKHKKKMVKVFRSIGCRLKTWNYTKITRRKRTGCLGEGQVRAVYIMLFWKNWKFKLSACRLGHFTLLFSQPYSWGWRERRRGMSFKDKNITCTNTHTWLTSAIFFLKEYFHLWKSTQNSESYSRRNCFQGKELFCHQ